MRPSGNRKETQNIMSFLSLGYYIVWSHLGSFFTMFFFQIPGGFLAPDVSRQLKDLRKFCHQKRLLSDCWCGQLKYARIYQMSFRESNEFMVLLLLFLFCLIFCDCWYQYHRCLNLMKLTILSLTSGQFRETCLPATFPKSKVAI